MRERSITAQIINTYVFPFIKRMNKLFIFNLGFFYFLLFSAADVIDLAAEVQGDDGGSSSALVGSQLLGDFSTVKQNYIFKFVSIIN